MIIIGRGRLRCSASPPGRMVLKPMLFPPHYKPGQKVPAGKIMSLPQNTINLSDGHLLQVTVALQLTAPPRRPR